MLSRRTTFLIGELYQRAHQRYWRGTGGQSYFKSDGSAMYEYLYINNYPAYLMNAFRGLTGTFVIKDFIMRLHTGESLVPYTDGWSWTQREKLGQQYLVDLARDFLVKPPESVKNWGDATEKASELQRMLELDGYLLRDNQLILTEASVLDEREEQGILEQLIGELALDKAETGLHHLRRSEDLYLDGKWDDSIGNSRKFLEYVLQEVAARHHLVAHESPIEMAVYDSPGQVRKYLEAAGLLELKEREAIAANYSLLSETGGHPYIAESEQARLMRHLALTWSQFVLLRLRGFLSLQQISTSVP